MGPRLKVSSDRLVKPGIEPATPGLQGKQFIHYTTAAPNFEIVNFPFLDGDHRETPGRQNKQSNQLSLFPIKMIAIL